MTRAQDVSFAVKLKVDAIGIILVPHTPRYVAFEVAQQLRQLIPENIALVAVVKDPHINELREIIEFIQPDIIQFHGQESSEFCGQCPIPYFKVISVTNQLDVQTGMQEFKNSAGIIFDACITTSVSKTHKTNTIISGGLGKVFDWQLFPASDKFQAHQIYGLAGGIKPENVVEALSSGAHLIDTASGTEAAGSEQIKGVKSHARMQELMNLVNDTTQNQRQNLLTYLRDL